MFVLNNFVFKLQNVKILKNCEVNNNLEIFLENHTNNLYLVYIIHRTYLSVEMLKAEKCSLKTKESQRQQLGKQDTCQQLNSCVFLNYSISLILHCPCLVTT